MINRGWQNLSSASLDQSVMKLKVLVSDFLGFDTGALQNLPVFDFDGCSRGAISNFALFWGNRTWSNHNVVGLNAIQYRKVLRIHFTDNGAAGNWESPRRMKNWLPPVLGFWLLAAATVPLG